MWQRFTDRARRIVFAAQQAAQEFGEGYVSTEHLLLAIARQPNCTAGSVLEEIGVSEQRIEKEVVKQLPKGDCPPSQDMTLTPRAKRVIDLSYEEARLLEDGFIGTEHLLLGLIREHDGLAGRVLEKLGVTLPVARAATISVRAAAGNPVRSGESKKLDRRVPPSTSKDVDRPHPGLNQLEFLALVLMTEPGAIDYLQRLGIGSENLRTDLEMATISRTANSEPGVRPLTEPSERDGVVDVLQMAEEECKSSGQPLRVEHMLIGIFREGQNTFAKVLTENGLTLEKMRAAL